MGKKSSHLDSNFSFIRFLKIFTQEPKTCPSWNASQWHNIRNFLKKKSLVGSGDCFCGENSQFWEEKKRKNSPKQSDQVSF
jgi:hypothetical protein